MFKATFNDKSNKSQPLSKNPRIPLHHTPPQPQPKSPVLSQNLESKLKFLSKSVSPNQKTPNPEEETGILSHNAHISQELNPSIFQITQESNLPLYLDPTTRLISATTTTTTTTLTTVQVPKKPPLTKSNNSSAKTLKPQQQQMTPNNSNKSLLNTLNNTITTSINHNNIHSVLKKSSTTIKPECVSICNNNNNNIGYSASRSMGGTPDTFKHRKKVRDFELPNHEPTKFSFKKNGMVKAYAVNTNQGIVRNYNEDRVSIILNIMKPIDRQDEYWPRCSFFGVYDGHGGVACADFLRDNLHQYVISNPNFPWNPKLALQGGFAEAEKVFIEISHKINENNELDILEKSGSCALVILIIGDMCFIANVGDSRAIMSGEAGDKIYALSRDHKPMDEIEYKRISEAGGKIYQTKIQAYCNSGNGGVGTLPDNGYLVGPYRVLPGRLSVTRTFGDIEAKLKEVGGNPNVVVAIPDIKCFQITEEHDFVILASDGIYDKLNNKDVIESVWSCVQDVKGDNIHQACANAVEMIMKTAISKRTVDNITVVMIAFSSFKYLLFPKRPDLIGNNSLDNITDYKKLQEINYINNSFDVANNDFSLELGLNNSNTSKNQGVSLNTKNILPKKNNIIRKKTTTNSISSNNGTILNKNIVKNDDKNKVFLNNGRTVNNTTVNSSNNNGVGRVSTKKIDNIYSHRTVHKNIEVIVKKK